MLSALLRNSIKFLLGNGLVWLTLTVPVQAETCNDIVQGNVQVGPPGGLTERQQLEIEQDSLGERAILRSKTNHTTSGVSESHDNDFIRELNIESLLVKTEADGYPLNLATESQAIRRNLYTPLLDAEEIIKLQNVFKELSSNRTLRDQLSGWVKAHDWNRRYFLDLKGIDLGPVSSPQEYRTRALDGKLQFLSELPAVLLPVIHTLEIGQSLRLRQLAWLAKKLYQTPGFIEAASKIKALLGQFGSAKIDIEKVGYINSAREVAGELISNLLIDQLWYLKDQLYYFSALHELSVERSWKTYPEILSNTLTLPYLKIVEGHSPVYLEEPAVREDGTIILSVPNTIELGFGHKMGKPNTVTITGPNAKGKSTLLRMMAQNVITAEMGLPVAASSMRLTPVSIYFHLNPRDAPSQNMSLFVNQAKELREKVFERVKKTPLQLILLDEILPGTVPELRTAAEKIFLEELADEGALTVVATHNWGTTELAKEYPAKFANYHVDEFHLRPGPQENMDLMISGAAEGLLKAGWTVASVTKFISEAKAQVAKSEAMKVH